MLNLESLKLVSQLDLVVETEIIEGLSLVYSGLERFNKLKHENEWGQLTYQQLELIKEETNQLKEILVELNHDESPTIRFVSEEILFFQDFQTLKPLEVRLYGTEFNVRTWSDVLFFVCEYLSKNQPERFKNYIEGQYVGKPDLIFSKVMISKMILPKAIGLTDIQVEQLLPENKIRAVLFSLVNEFNLSEEVFQVRFKQI
ncbi:MAG: hypothetical protein ACRCST_15320 [Turicibacter sp.]